MRISVTLISLALGASSVMGSSWFSNAAYNKWHENELERWLSDHDVPYPTPADRKDLEKLVQKNWESNVVSPYKSWDAAKLSEYLKLKGHRDQGCRCLKQGFARQSGSGYLV